MFTDFFLCSMLRGRGLKKDHTLLQVSRQWDQRPLLPLLRFLQNYQHNPVIYQQLSRKTKRCNRISQPRKENKWTTFLTRKKKINQRLGDIWRMDEFQSPNLELQRNINFVLTPWFVDKISWHYKVCHPNQKLCFIYFFCNAVSSHFCISGNSQTDSANILTVGEMGENWFASFSVSKKEKPKNLTRVNSATRTSQTFLWQL